MSNLFISHSYVYKTSFLISSQSVQKHINLPLYGKKNSCTQNYYAFCTQVHRGMIYTRVLACASRNIQFKTCCTPKLSVLHSHTPRSWHEHGTVFCEAHAEDGWSRLLGEWGFLAFHLHLEKKRRNSNWLGGKILGTQLLGDSFPSRQGEGHLQGALECLHWGQHHPLLWPPESQPHWFPPTLCEFRAWWLWQGQPCSCVCF